MDSPRALIESALRALGNEGFPEKVDLSDGRYTFSRPLQHSFFAATGLYVGPSGNAVVKFGRRASFFGVPLGFLGRRVTRHELAMYRLVEDLPGVPPCLGPVGEDGFAHVYVEGRPHRMGEPLDSEFFRHLQGLIDEVHRRDMAYVDLSKPQNILVGDDGRPHLIDFQIAWRWPSDPAERSTLQRWMPARLGARLLHTMQEGDRVHVLKHWRRSAPEGLSPEQHRRSIRRTGFIRIHDALTVPYKWVRRSIRSLWNRSEQPR